MATLTTKRLRSSTLIEVVIAMVIIVMVFGIALAIFTNINKASLSRQRLKAEALSQQALYVIKQSGDYHDLTFSNGDMTLEVKTAISPLNSQLTMVSVIAYDLNRQKLAEQHTLLINDVTVK